MTLRTDSPATTTLPAQDGPGSTYRPGVDAEGWHALDPERPPLPAMPVSRTAPPAGALREPTGRGPAHRWSLCGRPVIPAKPRWDSFAAVCAVGVPICPSCRWLAAIRRHQIGAELAAIAAALAGAPSAIRAAADLPALVLSTTPGDPGAPRTLVLLDTLTRHLPEPLLAEACAEGGCGHRAGADGAASCPILDWACPTCSLRAGSWAGEWEGQYEPAGTVRPPCSVLAAVRTVCHALRAARRAGAGDDR